VWSVWLGLLLLGVVYIVQFGPDVPLWDDDAVVPQLTGAEPITLGWLWSQHSEHRIPLARLILLAAFKLSGADPRPVLLLILGLLAGLAAALLLAARRARGRSHAADAFLPMLLLNLGHRDNLLWAIQVTYVLPVFLLGLVLAIATTSRPFPRFASLVVAAGCAALLPLCNAGGLAFIPALAAWFWGLAFAVRQGKSPLPRSAFWKVAILPVPAVLLLLFYFRGYEAPKHHAQPGGPAAAIRTAAQFLAMGLGEPGRRLWPASGWLVVGVLAAATLILLLAWFRRPSERARVEGLLWVLAAGVSLALGTGWGRSGEDVLAGLQTRYVTLAVPALLAAYFAFASFGPGLLRDLVPLLLMTGSAALLWPNTAEGWIVGRERKAQATAFDRDVAAGTPLFRLVRRHVPFLHPSQEGLHAALEQLRRAKVGKFATISPDPVFAELPVPLIPAELRQARASGGRIEATGPDPWIRFDLTAPVFASGIRLRYGHSNADGAPARFRMAWRRPGQDEFPPDQQYGNWTLLTGPGRTTTVWVDGPVSQIRIQPDNRPCDFTIDELVVLVVPRPDSRNP
jgi:hypothetical protein